MNAGQPIVTVATILVLVAPIMSTLSGDAHASEIQQTSTQLERSILQVFDREDDLDRLEVRVLDTEATVSGLVPHLYAKNQAIQLALAVDGIETVASEMELPERDTDEAIGEQVVKIINGYASYTIWDYLDGSINDGVVTLFGSVTPDRDKKGELYTQIAKIRGVQDYVDNIEILSPSTADETLRGRIEQRVFRSEHFERFRRATPPFHIVVNLNNVRLVGYVPTQIEYIEMERIVGQTEGVLRVTNDLQVLRQ